MWFYWLCIALWIQQPLGWLVSRLLIGTWISLHPQHFGHLYHSAFAQSQSGYFGLSFGFTLGLFWYFGMDAKQDRDWNPEVTRMLHYEQVQDQVTLHNVRNFDWHADGRYTERWETRQFNLKQITGVNIITSYWMGPKLRIP